MKTKQLNLDDVMKLSFMLTINKLRASDAKKIFEHHKLMTPNMFWGFKNKDIRPIFSNLNKALIDTYVGAYNCSLGHASMLRMAKALNWPYIMIFEDDAYPCDNVKDKLLHVFAEIPTDADCILFGCNKLETPSTTYSTCFEKVNGKVFGSHAYIIFNKAYNKYLLAYNDNPQLASDIIFKVFSSTGTLYKTVENLFILYNKHKSNWNCTGYMFNSSCKVVQTDIPPKGFTKVENILANEN